MSKPIAYDIRTHGIGARVMETGSKARHGLVVDIQETSFEWIDPFVLWDGEAKPERANAFLLNLEDAPK